MTYSEKLEETKKYYPFEKWRQNFFPDPDDDEDTGMIQYTQKNCDAAKNIFEKLITNLNIIGESSAENAKLKFFKSSITSLNKLNEKGDGDLIETGEREDLCELIDKITLAAGLNPKNYADGEGIADLWRDW